MAGEIEVKVFGYQYDSEDLIELQEVSFLGNIRELDKLIKFLQQVKEKVSYAHWYFGHYHKDVKLDEKGHIIEEDVAKSFEDCLAELEEAEDW